MRRIRLCVIAVMLAILVGMSPCLADEAYGLPIDTSMLYADITVGYLALDGATINPFSCTQWDLVSMNALIYESLIELDGELKPKALLAENWVQSDDGKTWTFYLREGIQFHNGNPLTAYDVISSYHRHLNVGADNPYYGRLATFIESMEVVDARTVRVKARYSGYITLYAMTFPIAEESTIYDETPRGSGPYWLIRYDMDSAIRLEMNPLWWKKQAKVPSVLFKRMKDTGEALAALSTGEIDMLSTQSPTAALSRKLSKYNTIDYSTTTYEMLIPNLRAERFTSNVNMRRAIMYAIDMSTVVTNAYLDMAHRSEVPVESTSWIYESQSAKYYYSPERALALILAEGWEDMTGDGILNRMEDIMLVDLTLNIITYNETGNTIRENAANLIAKYLNAVGIKTNVEVLTRSRVRTRINERDYDLALVGANLSEVPSLVDMFYLNKSLNLNNYSTEEMDNYLMESYTARTESDFKSAMSDLQMLVSERLPILGIGFRTGAVLSNRSLSGMSGNRLYDAFNGLEFCTE